MTILAIDTSAKSASVAILKENSLVAEGFINANITHSQTLMSLVKNILETSNTSIEDIDLFAVVSGPGSFTGLRIGICSIKGMAYALNKPCVPISALDAAVYNFSAFDGIFCATMDARCSQVYTATYHIQNNFVKRLTPDEALSLPDLTENLSKLNSTIVLVGDGSQITYDYLQSNGIPSKLVNGNLLHQRASAAALAAASIPIELRKNASELIPTYLRQPQAERQRKNNHGNS